MIAVGLSFLLEGVHIPQFPILFYFVLSTMYVPIRELIDQMITVFSHSPRSSQFPVISRLSPHTVEANFGVKPPSLRNANFGMPEFCYVAFHFNKKYSKRKFLGFLGISPKKRQAQT